MCKHNKNGKMYVFKGEKTQKTKLTVTNFQEIMAFVAFFSEKKSTNIQQTLYLKKKLKKKNLARKIKIVAGK